MEDKDRIIFEYDDKKYTIPKAANLIILPNSYVLMGDGWTNKVTPPNPGKLKLLFQIKHISMGQKEIAEKLGAVLAIEVVIKKVITCPNGCTKTTEPYCKKCGAKTEVTFAVEPANPGDKI
jgi:hypothetical protein